MKRIIIAVALLLAAEMLTGCNRAKDEVMPDGTKLFGERTLWNGTKTAERREWPNGEKDFDVTLLPDGTQKIGRGEFPNGLKHFDVTKLPDRTQKIGRAEYPDGEKAFDVTGLPDGTIKVGRDEHPNGQKAFDVTIFPDGTQKVGRAEYPDGEKQFDVTKLPDGTIKVGRVEHTNGEKQQRLQEGLNFLGLHSRMNRKEVESAIAGLGFVLIDEDPHMGQYACQKGKPNVEACRAHDGDWTTAMDFTLIDGKLRGYTFFTWENCAGPSGPAPCPSFQPHLRQLIQNLTAAVEQQLGASRVDESTDNELHYSWCGPGCREEVDVRHRLHNRYDTAVELSYDDSRVVHIENKEQQ